MILRKVGKHSDIGVHTKQFAQGNCVRRSLGKNYLYLVEIHLPQPLVHFDRVGRSKVACVLTSAEIHPIGAYYARAVACAGKNRVQ